MSPSCLPTTLVSQPILTYAHVCSRMVTYGVSGAGWPEFHNGVAAALRLSLGQTAISRTWIVYNKPESANYAHAGVLMGLGLQGHLKVLPPYLCY
jgi:hypothetical protein